MLAGRSLAWCFWMSRLQSSRCPEEQPSLSLAATCSSPWPRTGQCCENRNEALARLLSALAVLDAPLIRAAALSHCCNLSCKPGSCPAGGPSALCRRAVRAGKSLDLKGSYKEGEDSLFTRSHMEKSRGNGYNLHRERFHLSVRKKFFTVRTVIH